MGPFCFISLLNNFSLVWRSFCKCYKLPYSNILNNVTLVIKIVKKNKNEGMPNKNEKKVLSMIGVSEG